MGRFIKWLLILATVGLICLTIYAYLGPFFGVSFDPIRSTQQVPVILNES
jgi:hypothetical protein